jgi:hypothetical protein
MNPNLEDVNFYTYKHMKKMGFFFGMLQSNQIFREHSIKIENSLSMFT